MSDQNVREIHLSGKQLVFLFMASVVLAVAVFLLGVSVGRGVRTAIGSADPASPDLARATDMAAPAVMPPPTKPEARDLGYHDQLQGQTPPASQARPAGEAPTAAPPAADAMPVDEPQPSAPAAGAKASAVAGAAVASAARTAAAAGWVVQAGAFRSRTRADALAAKLKTAGLPAAVSTGAGGLFQVRVGPYAQRAEADRARDPIGRQGVVGAKVVRQ